MRITQNMMIRNYLGNANRALSDLSESNRKMASGYKYTRISDNVSDGIRALRAREQLAYKEQTLEGIQNAQNELASAESNMMSINDAIESAWVKAQRDIAKMTESDRETLAQELEDIRDQIVQFANAKYSDRYLFSGTNNATPPFSIDQGGKLLYNGIDVDTITQGADGKMYYPDPNDPNNQLEVPHDGDVYIDLNLGIRMNGDTVDPATGFKLSISGLDLLGFGKTQTADREEVSDNVVNMLTTMVEKLRVSDEDFDKDSFLDCRDVFKDQKESLMREVADLGARTSYLERCTDNMEDECLNLQKLGKELEGVDDIEETMNLSTYEYTWMKILQFGGKVFPTSLMDFIK